MAPGPSRKSEPVPARESDSEDSGEQSTQEDDFNPVKVAHGIVAKFKNTREESRNTIEAEHKKQVKDIAAKIDELFASRKMKVTKSQSQVFIRLAAVNKKRQAIESQILASIRTIEIHSTNISNELTAVYTGRIEEIDDSKVNP